MYVLDTDHITALDRDPMFGAKLKARTERSNDRVATTIVTAEEQLRGWLAQVNLHRDPQKQIRAYGRLQNRLAFFAAWKVLPWDEPAADQFGKLRGQGVRIGTMDLKIASIVMTHNAILLTRNLVDFGKVPGLQVDNWL
jgi:tRNA(fMet)-specific endonuclease VapC